MMKIVIVAALFIISCSRSHYTDPHVLIKTRLGDIEVEVYKAKAPVTATAFLDNVEWGIYDKSSFYRVLKTEQLPSDMNTGIIQGGIWPELKNGNKITPIHHESTKQTGLTHTDGIISMARTDTGTATTEFFICIGDQSPLDFARRGTSDGQGYAAFGKVFKGMDIVRKIHNQGNHGDIFDQKIEITVIKRL
ncbi:MAG: peptidylprolyl isomerase [Ferruginibacter sp.]